MFLNTEDYSKIHERTAFWQISCVPTEIMTKVHGYLLAILSAVSYGLIPYFILPIKQIEFPMDTTLFYRFLIASLFLFFVVFKKGERLKINKEEFMVLGALGLFYGLSSDLLFLGYDYLSAGIASTILFVYPVIVALIMVFYFREKLRTSTIYSLLLSLAGVYVLSTQNSWTDIRFGGLFITLGSALFYALYIITVNKARLKISGWKMTAYSLFFTSIYYLVKILFKQETLVLPDIDFFLNLTSFAFITTVISTSALVYAIKYIGSTPTAILGALEPVVAVIVSVVLFQEDMTQNLLIGVILILVGVIIHILGDSRKSKSHPTPQE